ncbi:MAG: DUF1579 domain-containing protein [Isosphaeraceae bacterium]|nr:DUF1579 domain-containing protein [Isosphaeraceae bacterium]
MFSPPSTDSEHESAASRLIIARNRPTPPTRKELIVELPQPTPEHEWLLQLVGDWTFDSDCSMGPEQPPMKSSGTQSTRSLGSFWILSDMASEGPDGLPMRSLMTLGFDTTNPRFVGTFVSSCMSHMWPYDGRLDAARKVLTLDSEGPSFENDGSMAKYQDIIEIIDKDHFLLSSQYRNSDGTWTHFRRAEYTRVPAAE